MAAWLETMGWGLACATVLVGIGALVQRQLGDGGATAPARAFWWGLLVAMPALFTWHLVAPIDGKAACALAAVGLVGLVREGQRLVAGVKRLTREHPLSLAAWVLLWCALPAVSLQPLTCVDGGFYYVAAVQWHSGFAQVPGLQATNPLSVMNLGAFVLTAAAGTGPFAGEGHLVFNAMLAWWGLPLALGGLERLAHGGGARALVVALAAAPGVDALVSDRMSCPSADIGVLWLGVAMSAIALPEPRGAHTTLRAALLAISLAPLYKVSLASFALVLGGLALWRHRRFLSWRPLGITLALCGLAWLPFVAGNVITSGYLLYPVASLGLPVDWALPPEVVRKVSYIIRSYSEHDGLQVQATLSERVARLLLMNREVLLPAVLLVGGSIVTVVRRARSVRPDLAPVVAAWVYTVTWFTLAPDPRFAGAGLWVSGALALGAGLPHSALSAMGRGLLTGLAAILLFGDVPFMPLPASLPQARPALPRNSPEELTQLEDGTWILDCSPRGREHPACWSVPSAAIFPDGLRRRDIDDLSRGFALPLDAQLPLLNVE